MNVHVTGRRIVATVLDGFLLGIAYNVFRTVFGPGLERNPPDGFKFTQLSLAGGVSWVLVVVLYYVLMEGYLGWTVGKRVLRIKVVAEATGGRPGPVCAFVRTVARLVDGLFGYVVALLVVVNSRHRRRLGDILAKTLVVRLHEASPPQR